MSQCFKRIYELIKTMINEKISYWKEQGVIPIKDFLAIVDFLDQTAGPSIFMNEKANDTLVQRVMKKVEELKLWQFKNSKNGFDTLDEFHTGATQKVYISEVCSVSSSVRFTLQVE